MSQLSIVVHLKDGVRDPAGEAVEHVLREMGFPVEHLRIGRHITLEVEGTEPEHLGREMAQRLLANPVLEKFSVEVTS
ncbi:MAG: phosphoribosylformylglycinamidine synthase subunit PurS [Clostridia bacterium]